MPGYIKKGRLTGEEISQAFFDTFIQEKMLRPHKKGASQVMEVCLANKEKQNSLQCLTLQGRQLYLHISWSSFSQDTNHFPEPVQ